MLGDKAIKKIFTPIIFIVLALLAWFFVWPNAKDKLTSTGSNATGTEPSQSVKVITQSVSLTDNTRIFKAVGTGRALQSVQIYPAVSEEVTRVGFKAGDQVSKGQVLINLDDRQEHLAIREAQVIIDDTRNLLQRYESAVKEGAVPESEVDAARADYHRAQVQLEQAQLALKERRIIAPFNGYTGLSLVDTGDRVSMDTPITTIDNREKIDVDFDIPENLSGVLQTSNKQALNVEAKTPAFPNKTFQGIIIEQESRIDPQSRTQIIRARFDNDKDELRPGMSFDIEWNIPGQKYPTVPEVALQYDRDGPYVWIISEGKASKVQIEVIARKAGNVLLSGDVEQGDQVVVEGVQRLREGQNVTILGARDGENSSAGQEQATSG